MLGKRPQYVESVFGGPLSWSDSSVKRKISLFFREFQAVTQALYRLASPGFE
jgi:hypothetical protein